MVINGFERVFWKSKQAQKVKDQFYSSEMNEVFFGLNNDAESLSSFLGYVHVLVDETRRS